MAQPPAAIIRTFKPVGQLCLHRLSNRARFRCVHCGRDKIANLVATIADNWAQTVCNDCYGSLVHVQREEAKKAAKAKRNPVQGKQSSREVKHEQPKRKPPEPIGKKKRRQFEKERQQVNRQLPGLDSLLVFFRAAGIRVELVRGRYLWIDGTQTEPLGHLPPSGTLEWNSTVNDIALRYLRDKFIRAVEDNARFGEGLRVVLQPRERAFAVMRDDVRLATIHATRAQVPHRGIVRANFLIPGPHWQQVADVVEGTETELVAEWKHEQEAKAIAEAPAAAAALEPRRPAVRRRIDHLPDDLAPELIAACQDASRRIRLERQVAYERPVVLESDFGELTLLPITGTGTRLRLPFRFHDRAVTLSGELVLSDRDPLPLLIDEAVADEAAIEAWIRALLGFADATCIELELAEPAARREPARPRWHPSTTARQRRSSTPALPRRRTWPTHLEPVGHWVRYSGSFVAGHRRHLNDCQTASAEARERARRVGIILHPNETWVRPHTRGVPEGLEMRFLWHPPNELRLPPA